MNQVYSCGTYFHIYVSLLRHLNRKDASAALLVLNDHTPEIEKIIPALREHNFFDEFLFVPFRKIEDEVKQEHSLLDRFLYRNKMMINAVEEKSQITRYAPFIRESEFNFFYLWGYPTAYFILKHPENYARILEDGARNYQVRITDAKLFKRKYILGTYIGDGFDEAIKEIQVQYPDKLHPKVRHKGTLLELRKMQDALSTEDKHRILSVFMKGQSICVNHSKKLLLITQPLSEDKLVSEAYKIALYKELLQEHGEGYEIYLKPHPRELTDYQKHLPHTFIEIPRSFPLEMFDLMKTIAFDKGLTLFSSAINNLNCIQDKVHLGRERIHQLLPGKKLV